MLYIIIFTTAIILVSYINAKYKDKFKNYIVVMRGTDRSLKCTNPVSFTSNVDDAVRCKIEEAKAIVTLLGSEKYEVTDLRKI